MCFRACARGPCASISATAEISGFWRPGLDWSGCMEPFYVFFFTVSSWLQNFPRLSISMRASRSRLNSHFLGWTYPLSSESCLPASQNTCSRAQTWTQSPTQQLYSHSTPAAVRIRVWGGRSILLAVFKPDHNLRLGRTDITTLRKVQGCPRACTNTHPLIISAHNIGVFSKREQRDTESVCIISSLL